MIRSPHSFAARVAVLAAASVVVVPDVASAESPRMPRPPPPQPVATDDPSPTPLTIDAPQSYEARVKDQVRIPIRSTSPNNQQLTYSVAGAPPGATLVPMGSYAELRWTPHDEDVGPHDMTVSVSDGSRGASHDMTIVVVEEWKSFFMPGLQYSAYGPNRSSEWGSFHGVSAEFLLYAWIARNENRGPSHGRFYVDFDVLFSTRTDKASAFLPTLGLDLSIERNPQRRVFLPYFGMETGGLFQKELRGIWMVVPFLGVHVFSSPNVFVNVTGGYVLPIDADRFDELRGWRAKVGIDFSLW